MSIILTSFFRPLLRCLLVLAVSTVPLTAQAALFTQPAPTGLSQTTEDMPASFSAILRWDKNFEAVAYELEIFQQYPADCDENAIDNRAAFRTPYIFMNAFNPPHTTIAAPRTENGPLWWRVRALDYNRLPISPFSDPVPLYTSPDVPIINAPPVHLASYNDGPGTTLLYPVYNWVRLNDASSYEVQLFNTDPDRIPAAQPIAILPSEVSEIYDTAPRYGSTPFYWRVRALDAQGNPLDGWSETSSFRNSPDDNWEVAVFGDSIAHGGGHISYSPADFEYSWLAHLAFSAINLSQSGNLTEDMLARFESDVLPFHPHYLIIMGGSNDLRDIYTVEDVIANMEGIKEKCRQYGIKPIFLTLPPINPANIQRAFAEETEPDWREKFAAFNEYLRQQPHIDTARALEAYSTEDGLLPEWLGLDGLHEDVMGKELMAARINADWAEACAAADAWQ